MNLSTVITQLQEQLSTEGDSRVDSLRLTLYRHGHQTTLAYDRPPVTASLSDGWEEQQGGLPSTTQRLEG